MRCILKVDARKIDHNITESAPVHKLSSSGALPARDSLQQGLELLRYDITAHILGHDAAAWLFACPKNDGVDLRQSVGLRNRTAALTMHSDEVRVASNQIIS
jgi:hypothetical protein